MPNAPSAAAPAARDQDEATAALRAAEAVAHRHRAIFESITQFAIIVTDRDGRVTDWNSGAERILGWPEAAMRGGTIERIFTSEDRAGGQVATEMRQSLERDRAIDERWHLKADGGRFWASGEMMVLRDADDRPIGFVKVLRDRTAEHLAGRALAEAEAGLRRAQEVGGVGLFAVDASDDLMRPTPEFCRLYGLPVRDSYPTTAFERLVVPEDRHLVSTAAARAAGAVLSDVEYRIRRPDTGELRWIARKGELQRDAAGRPLRFSGAARDVTEQHAARDALAAGEAYWRGLFQRLREGFVIGRVIRDAAGQVTDWRYEEVNEAWSELVGLPEAQAVGRTVRELIPDVEDAWISDFAEVVDSGVAKTFTRRVGTLDRWYEGRAHKLGDDSFALMFLDVTARLREERRQRALIELGDRLRDLAESDDVVAVAAELTAGALDLTGAGYGSVDPEGETITIQRDWIAEGQMSLVGQHQFRTYGSYIEALRRGEIVIVEDAFTDPRTVKDASGLIALDVRSLVNIPVMERGRFVGLFFMRDAKPRSWSDADIVFLRSVADRTRAAVARIEAEQRRRLLNDELSHRLKNTLAMVQSIATQTLRTAADLGAARDTLSDRLVALGRAHDALMTGRGEQADIGAIVAGALDLHDDRRAGRFTLRGPSIHCAASPALALALMVHELATNAAKYGALGCAGGAVEVLWAIERQDGERETLRLVWRERGGPPVVPPTRRGFGSRLIERGLTGAVGGRVELAYPVEGVVCTLRAPLSGIQQDVELELPSAG